MDDDFSAKPQSARLKAPIMRMAAQADNGSARWSSVVVNQLRKPKRDAMFE